MITDITKMATNWFDKMKKGQVIYTNLLGSR